MNVAGDLSEEFDTPFERWVAQRAVPERLEYFLAQQNQALLLDQAITGESLESRRLQSLSDPFVQDFVTLNASAVEELLLARLPAGLSRACLAPLSAEVRSEPLKYLKWMGAGITPARLADLFYRQILTRIAPPLPGEDRKILAGLAKEARHPGLDGLLKLQSRDVNSWKKSLEQIGSEEYQQQLHVLLAQGVVSASDAFSPAHLETWSAQSARFLKKGDLESVLRQIDGYKGSLYADRMSALLPELSQTDLVTLGRWVKSYPGYAPNLRNHLKATGYIPVSTAEKLRSIISGGSRKGKSR
jgi:hypothetical protein